jgi:hypothetical protein
MLAGNLLKKVVKMNKETAVCTKDMGTLWVLELWAYGNIANHCINRVVFAREEVSTVLYYLQNCYSGHSYDRGVILYPLVVEEERPLLKKHRFSLPTHSTSFRTDRITEEVVEKAMKQKMYENFSHSHWNLQL